MSAVIITKGKDRQSSDSVQIQNVIARITHGIIGLDFLIQGRKEKKYVNDLLCLEDEEIETALKTTSMGRKFSRFAPLENEIVAKQATEIIASVDKAKQMIKGGEVDREKIMSMIDDLEEKLAILYSL